MRNGVILIILSLWFVCCSSNGQTEETKNQKNENLYGMEKSDLDWKKELSPEEYKILRQCGTEAPGTGEYYNFFEKGKYICAACGFELFDSETKYSSGSGWPSFFDVISEGQVVLIKDNSLGMLRTEVRCANCGGHLGHVFPDGPKPTNLRYCINSIALKFKDKKEQDSEKQ